MNDDRGLIRASIGSGQLPLSLTAAALFVSGAFALFLASRREFLPHDVAFLGMTAEQLCAVADCRVVGFTRPDESRNETTDARHAELCIDAG